MSGRVDGVAFRDDFLTPAFTTPTTEANWGPYYKAFSSTGGTLLPATPAVGGIVTLGSDGDDEGASVATVGLPVKLLSTAGQFAFEARCKVSSIADTIFDTFIGFGDQMTLTATVPITATAGSMADENWVGFHHLGTDGDQFDTAYKADGHTAVYVGSDAITLLADTYVKVGMSFNPNDGYLRFYKNGVELADKVLLPAGTGLTFPDDVQLGLVAAALNCAGSITPIFTIDWWQYAQLAPGQSWSSPV
jgi:hypothetical protein